jgi:hypothetical protein
LPEFPLESWLKAESFAYFCRAKKRISTHGT